MTGDFQGQLVERSMSALPSVFTEVFSMQKAQTDELHKQQTLLEDLREHVSEGERKKEELEQEVNCVLNKIFQCEEAIKESCKTMRSLDTELKTLVIQLNDKQTAVRHKEDTMEVTLRKLDQHRERSEKFRQKVIDFEKSHSEVYRQVQEVKRNVQALMEQEILFNKDDDERERLLSGKMEQDVHTETECMHSKLTSTKEDTEVLRKQVAEEESKQRKLEQTLQVLEKRNAAQLTRMKRQVKEILLRNRQRQSQVNQLADKVAEARSLLQQ